MNEISWSDQQGSRDRKAGLLVVVGSDCYWFAGGSDCNVRVAAATFRKDGKWSHTSYRLEVSDGVDVYRAFQGWESGKWREGICKAVGLDPDGTWQGIAEKIGVAVSALVDIAAGKVVIRRGPSATVTEAS